MDGELTWYRKLSACLDGYTDAARAARERGDRLDEARALIDRAWVEMLLRDYWSGDPAQSQAWAAYMQRDLDAAVRLVNPAEIAS